MPRYEIEVHTTPQDDLSSRLREIIREADVYLVEEFGGWHSINPDFEDADNIPNSNNAFIVEGYLDDIIAIVTVMGTLGRPVTYSLLAEVSNDSEQ